MRKLIFILMAFSLTGLKAQEISDWTLGTRFGGGKGFGTELSLQKHLTTDRRIQTDLGVRNSLTYFGWSFKGTYQWVKPLLDEVQWYTGIGGGLGNWSTKKQFANTGDGSSFFSFNGIVGLEYFLTDYPLQASLDLMPRIGFIDIWDDAIGMDLAFSVRYIF